jgi:hypothetical protein
LAVWEEENILLDDPVLLEICEEHNIPYQTYTRSFANLEEAKQWVMRNQLEKDNLRPDVASYLRGKLYLSQKNQGKRPAPTSGQKAQKLWVAERMAKEFGLDASTIRREAAFAAKVDTLAAICGEQIREQILSGGVKATRGDIARLAALDPEEQRRQVHQLVSEGKVPKEAKSSPTALEVLQKAWAVLQKAWEKSTDEDRRAFVAQLLADQKAAELIRGLATVPSVDAGQSNQGSTEDPAGECEDVDDAVRPTHVIEEPAKELDKSEFEEDDDPAPPRRRPK